MQKVLKQNLHKIVIYEETVHRALQAKDGKNINNYW